MKKNNIIVTVLSLLLFSGGMVIATENQTLESAIDTTMDTQSDIKSSQKKINALTQETDDMQEQYRTLLRKTDSLKTYNDQLAKLIKQQKESLDAIERQLDNAEETKRSIVPLMLKMVDAIKQFVALDLPFLKSKREDGVNQLEQLMERADVSLPEKYRRIMAAYQAEIEFGRTIETYTDTITVNGDEFTVDILRIGRLSLAFQTLDGKLSGLWDKKTNAWATLPDEYNRSISKGILIAKKQAPPEFMKLPIQIGGLQ